MSCSSTLTSSPPGATSETEIDMGEHRCDHGHATGQDTFEAAVDGIKERLKTNDVLCCMSDHAGNFRKQVWPDYKSNRRKSRKPVGYVAFCDWVRETMLTASSRCSSLTMSEASSPQSPATRAR